MSGNGAAKERQWDLAGDKAWEHPLASDEFRRSAVGRTLERRRHIQEW